MIEFLSNPKILNGITLGMTNEKVKKLLGEPTQIIGDKDGGYLYYGHYRYGYNSKKLISEMSIEFLDLESPYEYKNLERIVYGETIIESFKLNKKSKIHKFIRFINHLDIEWQIFDNSNIDYLNIKLLNGPYAIFDLNSGRIFRISITG